MCISCLKKIMQERMAKKRNRDFAKRSREESPRLDTPTESSTSEADPPNP